MRLAPILLLMAASVALGQTPQTVLVSIPEGGGFSQGSGVLCGSSPDGRHRAVLTVAHVTGPKGRRGTIQAGSVRVRGVVVGANRQSDAAMMIVDGRGLEHIPNARLYMGEVRTSHRVRTEGFAAGRFRQSIGRPKYRPNRQQLWMSTAAIPGMSGGPTYLHDADQPLFLTTTTGSDFQTESVGPYRSYLVDWIPRACSSLNYICSVSPDGQIQLNPRRGRDDIIDGPIGQVPPVPTVPPSAPDSSPSIRQQLLEELKRLRNSRPKIDPAIQAETKQPATEAKPPAKLEVASASDSQVIASNEEVIEIPLTIKIRRTDRVRLEGITVGP